MIQQIPVGKYGKFLPFGQTLLDFILVNLAFLAAYLIIPDTFAGNSLGKTWLLFAVAALPTGVAAYIIHSRRMLRSELLVRNGIIGAFVLVTLLAALLTFFKIYGIRFGFFALLFGFESAVLSGSWIVELLLLKRARRQGRNIKKVVIVGTGHAAEELSRRLQTDSGYGNLILGFFDDNLREDFSGKYLGKLDQLSDFCRDHNVAEIYYTLSSHNHEAFESVVRAADANMCKFFYVPLLNPVLHHKFYMMSLNDSIPAIGIHSTPLLNPLNRAMKRSFDILFSSVALACSPIIFVPVALAIKVTSPGPIFFKQKRTGYMGRDFYCYKFRTMKVNKDADNVQATKNDVRKTRLGNFLRHSSIDELPQFWNVLKGDMSIVGPRPHMLSHTETYRELIDKYMVRHLVKPGITGWAQVTGFRGPTTELWQMEKRVERDVWYIEHWSFLLDMKIMVKTITNSVQGEENAV